MIWWIVIAVVVVGGGIWWWMASQNSAPAASNTLGSNTTSGSVAGVAVSGTQTTSYPQGNSDQAINVDMASVDAQLIGLNSANASITQSLNDQPVQQAL